MRLVSLILLAICLYQYLLLQKVSARDVIGGLVYLTDYEARETCYDTEFSTCIEIN